MKKGLVSITFRKYGVEKIVDICKQAGLQYIEWGGDIHVPSGDTSAAGKAAKLCADNGLIPVGYGSYYNAADGFSAFLPALESAKTLGAQYIRIWAGRSREYDQSDADNIKKAVDEAKRYGVAVSLECHRKTMTENVDNALRLSEECGCLLHFQPNPDISHKENLRILQKTKPYLCACHVFAWDKGDIRLPLSAHAGRWSEYAATAGDVPFLLEFVQNDSETALCIDAKTLENILK